MLRILLFLLVISPAFIHAQNIRVGLFSDKSIKEIEGIVGKGTYFVFKDTIQLAKLGPADVFKATYSGGVVRVLVNGVEKGRGKSIRLIQDKQEDYLQVPISVLRYISQLEQQQGYNKEELKTIAKDAYEMGRNGILIGVFNKWFEQFKNK